MNGRMDHEPGIFRKCMSEGFTQSGKGAKPQWLVTLCGFAPYIINYQLLIKLTFFSLKASKLPSSPRRGGVFSVSAIFGSQPSTVNCQPSTDLVDPTRLVIPGVLRLKVRV